MLQFARALDHTGDIALGGFHLCHLCHHSLTRPSRNARSRPRFSIPLHGVASLSGICGLLNWGLVSLAVEQGRRCPPLSKLLFTDSGSTCLRYTSGCGSPLAPTATLRHMSRRLFVPRTPEQRSNSHAAYCFRSCTRQRDRIDMPPVFGTKSPCSPRPDTTLREVLAQAEFGCK